MSFRRWYWFLLAVFCALQLGLSADAATLRIVYYNTECWGKGNDNAITGSGHSLPTIIQAIGLHHLGTNAQPVDVLALEELRTTTLANFVTQLNAIYGAGTYAADSTADSMLSSGDGASGLIYNTHTVQVISARTTKTGVTVLLQPNGTYTAAHSAGGGTNGIPRAPMVYQLRPVGSTATNDFYIYVSHARSTSDNTAGDARYAEAQCVRSDAKYKLPAGAHIIYGGDWNLFSGNEENAYKCLTGQTTSDGINWADTNSAVWANANPTQAYDPISKTSPPTTFTWSNSTADPETYFYTDSTTGTFTMSSRIDIQLVNGPMLAAYNNQGGVQLAPDTGDPFDTSNFPSSKYPYAFETFGNNGTTPRGGQPTNAANHSLDDLVNTTPNAATVYTNLTDSNTTGSDHYPLVGDYNLVPPPAPVIVLTPQGVQANGRFQLRLSSTPSTAFGIQSSPDLTTWTNIGSGTTDTTGALIFQDANTPNPDHRFYRAYWPFP